MEANVVESKKKVNRNAEGSRAERKRRKGREEKVGKGAWRKTKTETMKRADLVSCRTSPLVSFDPAGEIKKKSGKKSLSVQAGWCLFWGNAYYYVYSCSGRKRE
jgi:hypothetical protein